MHVWSKRIVGVVHGAIVVGAVTALAACATLEPEGITAGPGGGAYVVRSGAPLVIGLESDSTTGYGWELQRSSGAALLLAGGSDFTPAPLPAGMMGVAGTTTFRFRALEPGTAVLEFAYRLPLEQGVAPAKVVRYDVTVRPLGRLYGLFERVSLIPAAGQRN
ncbi:MAG: protease inhibitor I42 family protein [Casimicrobiaceae bacterium]